HELCRHAIVALTEVSEDFRARVIRRDVQFYELRKRPGHLWRYFPMLVRLFREIAPAIVHTRNLAALEATFPAWLAGVPVRIHGCPFTSAELWLVGTVGRLEIVKDQTSLARAFVRVLELEPSLAKRMRLVIVGEGPLRASIEKILADANAMQYAWLAGERNDV